MIRPVFHILVFGCNRLNVKDIEASTRYRSVHLVMTAIAENLFQGKGYSALVIYAGVEEYENLIERFRLYAPRIPVVVLSDRPESSLLGGKEYVWYADPADREKFVFSLGALWNFLEIFLAQRADAADETSFRVGGGILSFKSGVYEKNGVRTKLTLKQVELMKILIERRGEIVSRAELMDKIWLKEKFVGDRIIDTNMVALRKLFGDKGRDTKILHTCHGLGYCLAFETDTELSGDDYLEE